MATKESLNSKGQQFGREPDAVPKLADLPWRYHIVRPDHSKSFTAESRFGTSA